MTLDEPSAPVVRRLVERLLDQSPDEQERSLREIPDAALAQRARQTLQDIAKAEASGFLASADARPAVSRDVEDRPGDRIGDYLLDRVVGEGTYGVVWRAGLVSGFPDRADRPEVVAIKILKPGMDSRAIVRRFHAEHAALSGLTHPGLARALGLSSTRDGRPCFIMELVDGPSITEFCDEHRCSVEQRVQLLLQVCQAVAHAHERLLLHRDLKPANVLVCKDATNQPRPVVIDFGIAKVLDPNAEGHTGMTSAGQILGSPGFMSPEQREGGAILTIRSDVFALGALLRHLLIGKPAVAPPGWADERPSEVLAAYDQRSVLPVCSGAATTREYLLRALRRDLDWIVLRAQAPAPADRYGSATDLATDLQRYLDGKPVIAARGSRWYIVRKFTLRNRIPIALGLVLAFAAGVGLWRLNVDRQQRMIDEVNQARRQAEANQIRANNQRVNRLFKILVESADPANYGNADRSVREALKMALTEDGIAGPWEDREAEAVFKGMFVELLTHNEVLTPETQRLSSEALAARKATSAKEDDLLAEAINGHASRLFSSGRLTESRVMFEDVLAMCRRIGAGKPTSLTLQGLHNLAIVRLRLGDVDGASALLDEARTMEPQLFESRDDQQIAYRLAREGLVRLAQGKLGEAEQAAQAGLDMWRRLHKQERVAGCIHTLGDVRAAQQRYKEAEALYREAIGEHLRTWKSEQSTQAEWWADCAVAVHRQGRTAEAEALFRDALRILAARPLGDQMITARITARFARFLAEIGRTADARATAREAWTIRTTRSAQADDLLDECRKTYEQIVGTPVPPFENAKK